MPNRRPSQPRSSLRRRLGCLALLVPLVVGLARVPPAAAAPVAPVTSAAAGAPLDDAFYDTPAGVDLASVAPGTVLKTRSVSFHVAGFPLPLKSVQLLHRATGSRGQPTVNVTSVVKPLLALGAPKVVSYQSAYDSANPADQPSAVIAGGSARLGGLLFSFESAILLPLLWQGYTVVFPDTEGQTANFGAGREYGTNTLDSLRAAFSSPAVGVRPSTKAALMGYSGGAIATEWATELAPTYAPEIATRLVGSTMGGVLVNPARIFRYVEGSPVWSGVMMLGLVGLVRAYDIDLAPFLNDYGKQIVARHQDSTILDVAGRYPGLTAAQIIRPEFASIESIPAYVAIANQLIMGTGGTPSTPMHLVQGSFGELEGTPGNKPGIGKGDGVMVAGDVRTLARQYCDAGVRLLHREYPLSHVGAVVPWIAEALPWINDRFAGRAAPQNCGSIAPGNPLTPLPVP